MITIHMHLFYELYIELGASWWPIHDVKALCDVKMKHGKRVYKAVMSS